METLLRELRYGVRTLTKSPGFSLVVVLTLALGIGACTAIFSVVDAVLLRPLPYPNPQQIVSVWEQAPDGHRMNLADLNFQDFLAQNHTFSSLVEYAYWQSSVAGGSEPVRANIAEVGSGFFKTLGLQPFMGRGFTQDEQRVHGAPAAIVSYKYWRQYLGAQADLSKFHLTLEGEVYPVVGVMPARFDFPLGVSLWIPRNLAPDSSRTGHNWRGIGRVRDGFTVAQARMDLGTIGRRIKEQYGKEVDLNGAVVMPLSDAMVGNVRAALLTLLGAVGLLLLVACANVAGLLLARNSARRKELAVRAVLGAPRGRLIRQFLVESFLLSVAGGVLGVLIASAAVSILPAILPANLPRQEGIAINTAVLLFSLAAVLVVAVSFVLCGVWRPTAGDLQQALAAGSRGYSGGTQRLRGLLVAGEIALTLVILVGAGLLGHSFLRLISTDPGFSPQHLITLEFSPLMETGQVEGDAATLRQIHQVDEIVDRLRAIPGVETAGFAGALPVAAGDNLADGDFLMLNGQNPPANFKEFGRMALNRSQTGHAEYCTTGEDYFRTLGIPLVRGRMFGQQDSWDSPHVALISQSLAQQRWPNQDPIGQMLEFGNMDGNLKPLTVIGVVGDVKASGLDQPVTPIIYVDYRQRGIKWSSSPTIVLRSTAPVGTIASAARGIFRDLAPDVPVKVSTFADELGGWLSDRRFLLLLVGLFAAAALGLAAVGIYGVVAYSVTRRTQEIGVRMAMGAQRGDVVRLIVGEGVRLAATGVVIGIAASLLITRLLSSLLFGVGATDPMTFAAVAVLLTLVALLASYIPARRAMRLDPKEALRYE